MKKAKGLILNLVFFLQVLLVFLLFFKDRLVLRPWEQVVGRLHPALVHLPIGLLMFGVVMVMVRSQFRRKAFTKITLMVLMLTALSASVTALCGFFLSRQGDYGPEALTSHRNSGVALSLLSYFLLLSFINFKKARVIYFATGVLTIAAVFVAGHTGSILTHGENFLLAPLKSPEVLSEESTAFQVVVYPILDRKCVSCHNEAKAKGKFVMTSLDQFKKGGKNGVEWEVGKPGESRMIKYIHLPLGDDDHMPPDGKPQLTSLEIDLLAYWIATGADTEKKLAELPEGDSLKIMGTAVLAAARMVRTEEKQYPFSAAPEETIRKMNTPFRSVFPLYQNSPALQADLFIRESFRPESLTELKEVKEQLVVLNLSKMPITDADLAVIGTFTHLEKLNLNFSGVTGTGLSSLGSLKNLASLSLAGTPVTAESIKPLMAMAALRELFVWNTKVTEDDRKRLAGEYPKVTIVTTQFNDNKILRLGKPVMVNDGIVKKDEPVLLRHSMPGVQIHYTLDGANPDSLTASVYDKPLHLNRTTKIKATACKEGWYCSPVYEVICFVEGIHPDKAELLSAPDKQYPGEGSKTLTDGRKGFVDVFKEPSWLGFQNDPFVAAFTFSDATIRSIVLSYGKNVGSSIFPPEEVEVWAGNSARDAKKIKTIRMEQPTTYDPQSIEALTISLPAEKHSYFKLVAKPVKKIPKWHSNKDKKGWVFVDEVFFY